MTSNRLRPLLDIPVRSWLACHESALGALLLVLALAASLAWSSSVLVAVGPIRLAEPVSVLLLVPTVGGVGSALITASRYNLPAPEPWFSIIARAAIAICAMAAGVLVGLVGAFVADDGVMLGVLRNSLLSIGAGQVVASRFGISLIWLPSFVVALVAIFLGAEEGDRPAPWAVVLQSQATPLQLVCAIVMAGAGVVSVAWPRSGFGPMR